MQHARTRIQQSNSGWEVAVARVAADENSGNFIRTFAHGLVDQLLQGGTLLGTVVKNV